MPDKNQQQHNNEEAFERFDFVSSTARIAAYDDLRSAPRITEIQPAPTDQYIMDIATQTYEQARLAGGHIPFTIIKEVSENFIHARFTEIIVSILDEGNTIRFADQGPGIIDKDKAQRPGFSSATQAMKPYIRGVGSGLPIVKDYFDESHGTITIEDNISSGAVVTISLAQKKIDDISQNKGRSDNRTTQMHRETDIPVYIPPLSDREKLFMRALLSEGELSVTDLVNITGMANSSTFNTLKKLKEHGLIENVPSSKKRTLTEFGFKVANSL